ncbi:MAG: DUF1080 domain-containing protein, partial [Chloroflexia bacterium]|nr:DUF1080 domain-containing protein [Chloroflexia bacterium]
MATTAGRSHGRTKGGAMKRLNLRLWAALVLWSAASASGQEATIRVDAGQPGRPVSRYLAGACIEDVNHEVYGGIYSQMIFGESFQEPPPAGQVRGFVSPDGEWRVTGGEVHGGGGEGPKLVSSAQAFENGEAGVDVYLPGDAGGNAGLIVRVNQARAGADNFDGYEVSIDVARKLLSVGRHQRDFRLLEEARCDVAPDRWISLAVKLTGRTIEAFVDGKSVLQAEDDRPLGPGTVGLRQWQRPARYRNLWVKTDDRRVDLPFDAAPDTPVAISGMWGPVTTGDAVLQAAVETERAFTGAQSQRVTFASGAGEAGIENQGLNRWGMAFAAGKPYEGYVWLRAEKPVEVIASLESRDGSRTYARARLSANGDEWRRHDFELTPDAPDPGGRFSLRLDSPGYVVVGHAFLQPGEWGRFKKLPVRRDVVEGLIDQGVTALRYGGLMA